MKTAYNGKALVMEASANKSPYKLFYYDKNRKLVYECDTSSWHGYDTVSGDCTCYTDASIADASFGGNYADICIGQNVKGNFECQHQVYLTDEDYLYINNKKVKMQLSGYGTEFYSYYPSVSANYVYTKQQPYKMKDEDGEYYYEENSFTAYTSIPVYIQIFKI